jgi:hypothetical protein
MTKATPAGRTLTDPPAVPGGNPKHWESGQYLGRLPAVQNAPRREPAGRFLFDNPPLRGLIHVIAAKVNCRIARLFI